MRAGRADPGRAAIDDVWATEASHRALHERFAAAGVTYRDVSPEDVGADRIGHIGLLRERVGGPLWPELFTWILDG